MYKNLQQYKCGGCGCNKYNIYQEEGNKQRIIIECDNCKSQTEIVIRPAEIDLNWGESGDGIVK